jgi:CTP:molybdopterin cytidylyltransferase MocA
MIRPHTLNLMSSTWRARRPQVLLPTFDNKHGHPILINASAIDEILQLPHGATLKTITSRHVSSTLEIEVDDSAILDDIDTPADYKRLNEDVPCTNTTPV